MHKANKKKDKQSHLFLLIKFSTIKTLQMACAYSQLNPILFLEDNVTRQKLFQKINPIEMNFYEEQNLVTKSEF